MNINTQTDIISPAVSEQDTNDKNLIEHQDNQNYPNPEDICNMYLSLHKDQEINSQDFIFNFPDKINEKYPNCQSYKILVRAFSYLVHTENELFKSFCNTEGAIDCLLDHFIPSINVYNYQNPEDNEMRLLLINAVYHLFNSYSDIIGRFVESIKDFFSILVVIMDQGDLLSQIEAFRCITKLYTMYNDLFTPKAQRLWLFRIIAYCPPSSQLRSMAINFVSKVYTDDFQFIPLCNVLIKRGIEDCDSLLPIEKYLQLARDEDPFDIYIFLFKLLMQHPYFGQSAVEVICNTISGFIEDNDDNILTYIIFLFRKVMIFYAIANQNNKYKYRQFLIELLYQKIVSMKKIRSFKKSIQAILNAIIKNGYLKDFNGTVQKSAGIDDLTDSFLKEKEYISRTTKKLKLFALYPFDSEIDSALVESTNSDQTDSEDSYS